MPRHVYNRNKYNYFHGGAKNVVCYYGEAIRERKVKARITAFDGKKIIGWKKALVVKNHFRDEYSTGEKLCLIKLEIPVNTQRLQPSNYKCRASRAKVLGIYEITQGDYKLRCDETKLVEEAYSRRDSNFRYRVGKIVKPTVPFDKRFSMDCTSGIHFFLTKEEALKYFI